MTASRPGTGASDPVATRPWVPGASTGLGSLPGTDPVEASGYVVDEVGALPYLPELPGRGLGADLVGRTAALLVDFPVEWQPHGWTVASHSGRDLQVAKDRLRWDLDAFTERAQNAPVAKLQVCGPVTLAASMELPAMHKVLSDHGAFADLTESLAEGVAQHVADIGRQMPGTRLVLQVDEPSLPAALAARIATPSGYGTLRALDRSIARSAIIQVLQAAEPGGRVVHCCAADVPLELLRETGADALAVDLGLLVGSVKSLDGLGELIEAGVSLWAGIAPGTDAPITLAGLRAMVDEFWSRLGFAREQLAGALVPTPACGLAGATPGYVRRLTGLLRDVGESLLET